MSLWSRVFRERRAVIVPLILVLVANAGMLLVVWRMQATVAAAHVEALDARTAMATAKRDETQAARALALRTHADEDLKRFYGQVLPPTFATATRTADIWFQRAARATGLVFQSSHFDVKYLQDSRLSRAASTISLSGRYPEIRRFLANMEGAKEFVVLERVELAQPEEALTGPNEGLDIQLGVSTYFPAEGQR